MVDAQMPTPNPEYDPDFKPARPKRASSKPTKPVKTPLGIVTASSNQSGNPPEHATDGKTQTRWAANGDAAPQWWMVEFDESKKLSGVTVRWKNKTWFDHRIEVSKDGKEWKTAAAELESREPRQVSEHAFEAEAKGDHSAAAEAFIKLAECESSNPNWLLRAGENFGKAK